MLHARRELTLGGVWRGGSSRLAMLMITTLSAQPEATESKNFIHTHKERNDPRKFGRIYLHFLANGCCNDRFCDSITGNLGSSKWENIGHAKNDAFLAQHQSDSIYHARWISSDSMTQLEKHSSMGLSRMDSNHNFGLLFSHKRTMIKFIPRIQFKIPGFICLII